MKLNLFQVVIMATGATLIYAGVKGENPIEIIKSVLTNTPRATGNSATLSDAAAKATMQAAENQPIPTIFLTQEGNRAMTGGVTRGMPVAGTSKFLSV